MKKISLMLFLFLGLQGLAQKQTETTWIDLAEVPLHGRTTENTVNPFQRFPDSMKAKTRKVLWNLSRNPAGVNLRFTSTATKFTVRYEIEGEKQFPHMPATGVSGLDLYVKDNPKDWQWVKGNYHFSDTISYTFQVSEANEKPAREFMLYLPLYASLKGMKIGFDSTKSFQAKPAESSKPIAIYGTSITQGACASRPGNAWTNKLSRSIGIPVLNFGFSGNGRLEPEIVDYLAHLNAKAYVLDCLANFTAGNELDADEAYNHLLQSVKIIRKLHPQTPIILTDHAGYGGGETFEPQKNRYESLNAANHRAFKKLKAQGIKQLYLLSFKELGLASEDFVDGTHPTDGGMEKYARAFEKMIVSILNKN